MGAYFFFFNSYQSLCLSNRRHFIYNCCLFFCNHSLYIGADCKPFDIMHLIDTNNNTRIKTTTTTTNRYLFCSVLYVCCFQYELLFCVEDELDPALMVVRSLMEKYPKTDARLFTGKEHIHFSCSSGILSNCTSNNMPL